MIKINKVKVYEGWHLEKIYKIHILNNINKLYSLAYRGFA